MTNLTLWGYGLQSPLKGGTQAKGIWEKDPAVNIWAQKKVRMGSGEGFKMNNLFEPFT